MIFKTFDSSIDKISAKWGMFGRSFNDIGTAIVGRLTDIKNGFQATDDLIGSIKDSDSIWKRLYPPKESIQSQLFDIDALFPDKSDSQFSSMLTTLVGIDEQVKSGIENWQDYFIGLGAGEKWQIDFVQNTDLQKASLSDVKKAYESARDSALAHNEALKAQTLSAKAGAVALKALTIGLNMVIMYGATKLIGSFVNFIDNLHTTLKEQQEITQNLQGELSEIQSDISDVNSELQTTSDRIDELNKKDSLSFIEKEELENLTAQNEELERRNRLQATNICTIPFICKYRNRGIPVSMPLFVYLLHYQWNFAKPINKMLTKRNTIQRRHALAAIRPQRYITCEITACYVPAVSQHLLIRLYILYNVRNMINCVSQTTKYLLI